MITFTGEENDFKDSIILKFNDRNKKPINLSKHIPHIHTLFIENQEELTEELQNGFIEDVYKALEKLSSKLSPTKWDLTYLSRT